MVTLPWFLALTLSGCGETMTNAEIQDALDASVASAKAEGLSNEVIEISTNFTIGEAVEDAAEELRSFLQSQVPCSTVTRAGATLTMDFGTLDDACSYNGHTYAGIARITVNRNTGGDVEVLHSWEGLTNGDVTLDGEADVTWAGTLDGGDVTRHIVHDVTWTDAETGLAVDATGDRTMRLVDAAQGLPGGVQIDGTRDWTGETGDWHVDIDGVQMRGQDPVPQAGTYTLETPANKSASLSFTRIDDDTIRVTFTSGWRTKEIDVTSMGN